MGEGDGDPPEIRNSNVDEEVIFTDVKIRNRNPLYRFNLKFSAQIEKEISSAKLSCYSINLSQLVLHKQFPLVEGLQDTELGPLNKMTRLKNERIQILFGITRCGEEHWCTVHFKSTEEVLVYDSCSSGGLDTSFKKQICYIANCQEPQLNIKGQSTQQQNNNNDCGVFSIAWAVDILFGKDPCESAYNVNMVRAHLTSCLEAQHFSPFPPTVERKRIKRCNKWNELLYVYYTCRQGYYKEDKDSNMAECNYLLYI